MSKKNLPTYPPVTLVGYVYGMVDKLGRRRAECPGTFGNC
jgi:hypothetical protein